MTNTCETCGEPITRKYGNRPGRFCSTTCYHQSPTKRLPKVETTKIPRQTRMPGHPLAPKSGIVGVSRVVLYEKIGPGPHACHWCKQPVDWKAGAGVVHGALIADHLDWNNRNDDPDNLVPSCNGCNAHRTRKGDRAVIQPDELTVTLSNGQRTRAVERYCVVCGSQFVVAMAQVKAGKGFYCSRSCARKAPHVKHQE